MIVPKGGTRAFPGGKSWAVLPEALRVPGEAELERVVVLPQEELRGHMPKTQGTPEHVASARGLQGGCGECWRELAALGPHGKADPSLNLQLL